jgi:hypothetical protein
MSGTVTKRSRELQYSSLSSSKKNSVYTTEDFKDIRRVWKTEQQGSSKLNIPRKQASTKGAKLQENEREKKGGTYNAGWLQVHIWCRVAEEDVKKGSAL